MLFDGIGNLFNGDKFVLIGIPCLCVRAGDDGRIVQFLHILHVKIKIIGGHLFIRRLVKDGPVIGNLHFNSDFSADLCFNHCFVMHALEQNGFHYAFQFTFSTRHDIQILGTDNNVHDFIFAKPMVYAGKAASFKYDFIIFQHNALNDIAFANEIRDKFIYRLVINICRCANLLDFSVFHDNNLIRHR